MKCLFVCHDPPAPANNGGAIDMLGMLESLARLGADVHLLITAKDPFAPVDVERLARSARRTDVLLRNTGLFSALSIRPYQIESRRALARVALSDRYDVVIASDHCSGVLTNPSLKTRYRIIRRNNDESLYARRMMSCDRSLLRRAFYLKESILFRRWVAQLDRSVDQVWYVSEAEWKADEQRDTGSRRPKRLLVPIATQVGQMRPPSAAAIAAGRVLYFGSLTIPVNREGVDWFVENVHPRLVRSLKRYRLVIAGRVTAAEQQWAAKYAGRRDLDFFPNPENPEHLYGEGGLFIDPRAHDAGVKVKVIEAIRNGYAVVCSPSSLHGSGLRPAAHARVAVEANEFASQIESLIGNPADTVRMVKEAQALLEDRFNIDRYIADALEQLDAGYRRERVTQ